MGKITRFEEIRAWQMAKELVASVYQLTERGGIASDYGLRDQIRRAAISVMSNIAEGFERGSRKEFQRFLYMAKGSAGEVRSHLYVALELGYLPEPDFRELKGKAEDLSRSISRFISYLSNLGSSRTGPQT